MLTARRYYYRASQWNSYKLSFNIIRRENNMFKIAIFGISHASCGIYVCIFFDKTLLTVHMSI